MKVLDETYDFSYVLMGLSSEEWKPLIENLKKSGFDRVVGRTNQYGYPKYQYALMPGDPVPSAYLVKERSFIQELR